MATEEEIQPIEGEVISLSMTKALLGIGAGALIAPLGLIMFWSWLTGKAFLFGDSYLNILGGFIGLAFFVAGCCIPPYILWKLFIQQECLILGRDCFQIVVMSHGERVVNTQVPYEGIDQVEFTDMFKGMAIGIRMKKLKYPGFYHHDIRQAKKLNDSLDYHIAIRNAFDMNHREIYRKILKAKKTSQKDE